MKRHQHLTLISNLVLGRSLIRKNLPTGLIRMTVLGQSKSVLKLRLFGSFYFCLRMSEIIRGLSFCYWHY